MWSLDGTQKATTNPSQSGHGLMSPKVEYIWVRQSTRNPYEVCFCKVVGFLRVGQIKPAHCGVTLQIPNAYNLIFLCIRWSLKS